MEIATPTHSTYKWVSGILGLCIGTIALVFAFFHTANQPPNSFPIATDVIVDEGATLRSVAEKFAEQHIVRSAFLLYLVTQHAHGDTGVQAGTYRFESPLTTEEIAIALTKGENRSPLVSVTFPEGFQIRDLADFLPEFIVVPENYIDKLPEGYLFPDTYHISKETTFDELIAMMQQTFTKKTEVYSATINASGFSLAEVVTLASIIEREAKDTDSKHMVSGILQNRLAIGMPLQVDASFDYLLEKESAELSLSDLEIDNPYNTYKYPGLPPGPISNPGLDAIDAVLYPTESEYLYYLTGTDGTFHYAKTFEEHKRNKEKYLR